VNLCGCIVAFRADCICDVFSLKTFLCEASNYLFADGRQKRKLDEMYDQLRAEYESIKRSAIQPAGNFYSRAEPHLFSNPTNLLDNQDTARKGKSIFW